MKYRHENGTAYDTIVTMSPNSRMSVAPPGWLPAGDIGIRVGVYSGAPIVAERSMYTGTDWTIGHNGVGVTAPGPTGRSPRARPARSGTRTSSSHRLDPLAIYIDPFMFLEPDVIVYGRAGPGPDWAIIPFPRGGFGGGGGGGGNRPGTPPPPAAGDPDPDDDGDPGDPNPGNPIPTPTQTPTPNPPPKEPGEPEPDRECQSFGQRWWNSVSLTHQGIREFFDPWPANPVPIGVGLLRIPKIPRIGLAGTPSITEKVVSMYHQPLPGIFTVLGAWRAGTGVATTYATVGLAEGAVLAGAGFVTTSAMMMAAAEAGIMTGAAIDASLINRCGQ